MNRQCVLYVLYRMCGERSLSQEWNERSDRQYVISTYWSVTELKRSNDWKASGRLVTRIRYSSDHDTSSLKCCWVTEITAVMVIPMDNIFVIQYFCMWHHSMYCTTVRTTLSHLHILYTVHTVYTAHCTYCACFPVSQFSMFVRCCSFIFNICCFPSDNTQLSNYLITLSYLAIG